MINVISGLNHLAQGWFDLFVANTIQMTIIFLLVFMISSISKKKSAVFLYSLWSLFLLKALFVPGLQISFFKTPNMMNYYAFNEQLSAITYTSPITSNSGLFFQFSLPQILFIIWLIGFITLVFLFIRNERLFNSSLSQAMPMQIDDLLEKLQCKMELNRSVRVFTSPNVPAPFTRGLRKPVIYLPERSREWSSHQLNHILSHELAHIKRKDILFISFQNIINIIYFFNPLVWIANHQINFQREKICDDIAVSLLDENPSNYGRTLMDNLESFLVNKRIPLIANGFFFSKKTIIKRFEYLFTRGKEIKMKLSTLQKGLIAGLVLIVVILSCNNQSNDSPITSVDKSISEKAPVEITADEKAKFIPYDTPPEPIGGFAAIQKNVIYPEADQEAGHEGTVIVQAFLDENGDVTEAVVLKSPGLEGLNNAAIDAIKKTKFKPAMQKEKPVGVYISVPVVFKLDKNNDIK
ncbi:MAG: M56 family metallopeptidase [Candidatus Marinimicrobia bacterium]|nr:M56 family metallopeptidase [Candidatus Neomarinimicrobiota bacterium]